MHKKIERNKDPEAPASIPQPVPRKEGMVMVDSTWGKLQPFKVAEGVQTVGEVEVIEHIEKGLPIFDGRTEDFFMEATLPGAKNIPHTKAAEKVGELDAEKISILFCNGPQCGQSPRAIRALLDVGYPAEKLMYYRGGMHDWMTLGLPVERPGSADA